VIVTHVGFKLVPFGSTDDESIAQGNPIGRNTPAVDVGAREMPGAFPYDQILASRVVIGQRWVVETIGISYRI